MLDGLSEFWKSALQFGVKIIRVTKF